MELEHFTMDVQTENAAMVEPDQPTALADLLRAVADRIESGDYHPGHTRSIMDANGNRVGSYRWGDETRD